MVAAMTKDRSDHAAIAAAMTALSHPRRVLIYETLAAAPDGLAYGDLLARTRLSLSSLNHHLRPMRAAGVVATRRRGGFVIYRCVPAALGPSLARVEALATAGARAA